MRTTSEVGQQRRSTPKALQRIRTDVILGSPSANCSGVGICRVMAYRDGGHPHVPCPYLRAWLSVTNVGRLRFEFEKTSLSAAIVEEHFPWMLFQVLEPYIVPYRLLPGLKIAERTIRPGVYQVWDSGSYFLVEF
ncbi:MAG: hypothetical protein RMJ33_12150 [Saprospiraceae bacterium]|nr:hypothetical protein [Saprospiraceae bacterium]